MPTLESRTTLDICPKCGGNADNGHDREFPPNPYFCKRCSEPDAVIRSADDWREIVVARLEDNQCHVPPRGYHYGITEIIRAIQTDAIASVSQQVQLLDERCSEYIHQNCELFDALAGYKKQVAERDAVIAQMVEAFQVATTHLPEDREEVIKALAAAQKLREGR